MQHPKNPNILRRLSILTFSDPRHPFHPTIPLLLVNPQHLNLKGPEDPTNAKHPLAVHNPRYLTIPILPIASQALGPPDPMDL